jgi:hypothetical protein
MLTSPAMNLKLLLTKFAQIRLFSFYFLFMQFNDNPVRLIHCYVFVFVLRARYYNKIIIVLWLMDG